MTQAQMAADLGMTQANLSRIEAGQYRISIDLLQRISLLLGLDPADALRVDSPHHGEAA